MNLFGFARKKTPPATAQTAKETCPVSKALAGTTITLDAALD